MTGSIIWIWSDQIESLVEAVSSWTGNRLAPLVLTETALAAAAAAGEPLVDSLRDEAVPLTGNESLRQLLEHRATRRGRSRVSAAR